MVSTASMQHQQQEGHMFNMSCYIPNKIHKQHKHKMYQCGHFYLQHYIIYCSTIQWPLSLAMAATTRYWLYVLIILYHCLLLVLNETEIVKVFGKKWVNAKKAFKA